MIEVHLRLKYNLHIVLPSVVFQKVKVPSSVPVIISDRFGAQVIALTFYLPFKVAINLAYFYLPGLSRSKTLSSPSS